MKRFLLCFFAWSFFSFSGYSQNNCLNFNGYGDNVLIPHHQSLNFSKNDKFTIEVWLQATSAATNYRVIFSKRRDVWPWTGYELLFSSGRINFGIISTYPNDQVNVETNNTFDDGNWHHVACVYHGVPNPGGIDIYVDGVLETTSVLKNGLTGSSTNTVDACIGARENSAYYFIGELDEVRIWKKDLCLSQILARMNCNLTGLEPDLVSCYKFNQGTGGGNNTAITNIADLMGTNPGQAKNFSMSGQTSNFVSSLAGISGTCAPFSISGNTTICSNQTVVLTASGAASYTWSNGSNSPVISVSPTVTTTYTVSTGSDLSCIETKTVIVNVMTGISLSVSQNATICTTQTAILSAGGASTFTWSTGSNSQSIAVNPSVTTIYTVSAGNANCTEHKTVMITVKPGTSLSASGDKTICLKQSILLSAVGAPTFTWSNGSNANSILVSPTVTTTYTVSSGGAATCVESRMMTVNVNICESLAEHNSQTETFFLYPNPATESFNVSGAMVGEKIIVFNALGELILTKDVVGEITTIETRHLPHAMYFVRIVGGTHSEVKRVLTR